MTDPANVEDYNAKFMSNSRVEGYGIDNVRQITPCPFCAEPDFATWRIMHVEQDMQKANTCNSCGRSAKFIFHINEAGHKSFELVQTGGPVPADYLPQMKRVDN